MERIGKIWFYGLLIGLSIVILLIISGVENKFDEKYREGIRHGFENVYIHCFKQPDSQVIYDGRDGVENSYFFTMSHRTNDSCTLFNHY